MSERIAIVGVGETEFKRGHPLSLDALVVQAARRAIADSGMPGTAIDGIITPEGQPAHDEIALGAGMVTRAFSATTPLIPGAGPVAAILQAQMAISAGLASAVLIAYGTQTSKPGGPYAYHAADPLKADLEMPVGYYGQPLYFAALAQRYQHEFGLEAQQLGSLAVAQRDWASRTPGAQKSAPITMDDYLAAPYVAEPLRNLDCCLISDGAAAFIVTSLPRARDLPARPAVVSGVAAGSNPWTLREMFTQSPRFLDIGPGAAGRSAFEQAGIGPGDVDFAEIYDCFTLSIILQLESLGFCKPGEGASFVAGGRTGPGGALPVNTHGGHLSHAYIPGITHVIEAVRQIRGQRGTAQVDGAQIGLVSVFGGPDHATLVLTRDR
ncbi:MAG TPA: thiolase family protein [Steroidobacteraceae bacterium]|nr:thiolase family protein [Steroidobacteraceae bacterium]